MLRYALIFAILALIAGVLGFVGLEGDFRIHRQSSPVRVHRAVRRQPDPWPAVRRTDCLNRALHDLGGRGSVRADRECRLGRSLALPDSCLARQSNDDEDSARSRYNQSRTEGLRNCSHKPRTNKIGTMIKTLRPIGDQVGTRGEVGIQATGNVSRPTREARAPGAGRRSDVPDRRGRERRRRRLFRSPAAQRADPCQQLRRHRSRRR